MFKKIIVLGLSVIMIVAFAGCGDEQWTMTERSSCYHPNVESELYRDNYDLSAAAYQEAIKYFFSEEDGKYTDDYGGAFVDENGISNICVVGKREPVKSDYLIYKRVKNSYNFLHLIHEETIPIMQEFTIWQTSTCVYCNKVLICLEDESQIPLLVKYLKKKRVYRKDSLHFFVGEAEIYEDHARLELAADYD